MLKRPGPMLIPLRYILGKSMRAQVLSTKCYSCTHTKEPVGKLVELVAKPPIMSTAP